LKKIWTYILLGALLFTLITATGCIGDDDEGDDEQEDDGSEDELASETESLEIGTPKDMKVGDNEFNIGVESILDKEVTLLVDQEIYTVDGDQILPVDLDGDGQNDIEIEFVSIDENSIDIKVSELAQEDVPDKEEDDDGGEADADKETETPVEGEVPSPVDDGTEDPSEIPEEPEEVENTLPLDRATDVTVGGITFTALVTNIDGNDADVNLANEAVHMTVGAAFPLDLDGDGAHDVEVECMMIEPDAVTIKSREL